MKIINENNSIVITNQSSAEVMIKGEIISSNAESNSFIVIFKKELYDCTVSIVHVLCWKPIDMGVREKKKDNK
jgi:hypothetical protein